MILSSIGWTLSSNKDNVQPIHYHYQFTSSLNPPSTIGITHTLHLMNKETATPIHTYGWARSQFRKYSMTSDSLRQWPQFAFQLFQVFKTYFLYLISKQTTWVKQLLIITIIGFLYEFRLFRLTFFEQILRSTLKNQKKIIQNFKDTRSILSGPLEIIGLS